MAGQANATSASPTATRPRENDMLSRDTTAAPPRIATATGSTARRPVFVASDDRRSRRLMIAGRLFASLCVLYVVLVIASLVGAPWVPRLALPRPGPDVSATPGRAPAKLPASARSQPVPVLKTSASPKASTSTTSIPSTQPTAPGGPAGNAPSVTGSPAVAHQPGVSTAPSSPAPSTTTPTTTPTTTKTNPSGSPGTTAPGRSHHP